MNGEQANEERFGFKAKGQFRCISPFEKGMTVASLVLGLLVEVVVVLWMANPNTAYGGTFGAVPFAIAIIAGITWWFVRIAHSGRTYYYEADDSEFRIIRPNKSVDTYYYTDMDSIDYKPIHYINGKHRGYLVTVRTKYCETKYSYIFSKNKLFKSESGTPFSILARKSGIAQPESSGDGLEFRT